MIPCCIFKRILKNFFVKEILGVILWNNGWFKSTFSSFPNWLLKVKNSQHSWKRTLAIHHQPLGKFLWKTVPVHQDKESQEIKSPTSLEEQQGLWSTLPLRMMTRLRPDVLSTQAPSSVQHCSHWPLLPGGGGRRGSWVLSLPCDLKLLGQMPAQLCRQPREESPGSVCVPRWSALFIPLQGWGLQVKVGAWEISRVSVANLHKVQFQSPRRMPRSLQTNGHQISGK